jgi:hypothetical protein
VTLIAVFSGPIGQRGQAYQAIIGAGMRVIVSEPTESHGLPSYPDPLVAHEQGAPNAGHTPGTKHPATLRHFAGKGEDGTSVYESRPHECENVGEDYEADTRIGFVTLTGSDSVLDAAARAATTVGWQLRMHGIEGGEAAPGNFGEDERIATLEARIAALEGRTR